ncbi:hypothetical protein GCM10007049_32040 [Echinicola pacifica]|uniref:Transglutaminase-like superfamily protein n=1 Tax=Echinicola pacifica TaxID=346377 RepID=A0A918Q6T5_9BACT|nr:hypothetical protein [Echinicola pacifica]GGZ36272.1 hypothetical protein GCM10007049_32040 [Echinicola pacifica]
MMKKLWILIALVGVVFLVNAQDEEEVVFETTREEQLFKDSSHPLNQLVALHARSEADLAVLDKLVDKLDKSAKKKKFTEWFLAEVFYKSHQYALKDYQRHSTFNDLLEEGKYDCVSGSALFAYFLDRYEFNYEIIETDFHVFVLVHQDDKTYVMESTEPRAGLITDQASVKEYIGNFLPASGIKKSKAASELAGIKHNEGNTIYSSINLKQLAGLQYYNDAVFHFNEGDVETAKRQLYKAKQIYAVERVLALDEYLNGEEKKSLARR